MNDIFIIIIGVMALFNFIWEWTRILGIRENYDLRQQLEKLKFLREK